MVVLIFVRVGPDEEPRTTRAGLLRKIARGRVNRVENGKPFHAKTEAVPWENRKPFHGKSGSCSWENRKPCTRTYGRHRADRTDGAVATVRTPPCQPCGPEPTVP